MKTITTLVGSVGGDPEQGTLPDGRAFANLRLAVNPSYYDRAQDAWVDGDASWYDVRAYGTLATHLGTSVKKGDPLVVHGELIVRPWENGTRSGIAVEVIAHAAGPNLRFGTVNFARSGQSGRSASSGASSGGWDGLGSPRPEPGAAGDEGEPGMPDEQDGSGTALGPGASPEDVSGRQTAEAGAGTAPF
ncbi:single-stranded DNA-binding protein [Sediminivirga luteola]|uniref:Single-stranded DNA-binding protein n=1 Tax=Sediminivirga luteola TaxID=1774748 RepID=A0A8J2XLA0_9MICO|nr:single-stranded DNA-binding protein [Sediminivirga luteola]GGA20927.1 hypothetical protein GCM10011333_25030 [Sediminivirga luteola]